MFGKRIVELRKRQGLTQAELARTMGISRSALSLYEIEKREPDIETLNKLASLFNVPVGYILGNDSVSDAISEPRNQIGGYDNSVNYWIGKSGLGYDEVANRLGISEDLLSDYIQDRIPIPYQILTSLSDICEVSTDCLLGISPQSRNSDFNNILPFRYNYQIAERIRRLCDESYIKTTSSFLENLLSLSSQEVFYLIEYGFVPHMDTIIKLADYFNVSTDYLLCQINEQDEKVLRSFQQLNEDNKDIIVGQIKKYLKEQHYESVAADEPLKKTGTANQGK